MIKPDEIALFRAVLETKRWPRDVVPDGMHHKRLWAICEKWARKGFYEYGVSCDLGWFIDVGYMKKPEFAAFDAMLKLLERAA